MSRMCFGWMVVIAAFWGFSGARATEPASDPGDNPLVAAWADAVFDALDGRTWLLTDGTLDAWLVARAAERDLALIPMPLRQADVASLARFEAAVAALGSDRLRAAAALGSVPFLIHWLREDPEAALSGLALLVEPAVARVAGFEPLPQGVIHHLYRPGTVSDDVLDRALARYLDVREQIGEAIVHADEDAAATSLSRRLRAHVALCGNNLGCLLATADRGGEAMDVLLLAHSLHPEGYSALLNMASLVRRGIRPERMDALGQEMNAILRAGGGSWNLASTGGFVLHPEDFLEAKWFWASSGLSADNRDVLNDYLFKIEDETVRGAVARQLSTSLAIQSGGAQAALALLAELPETGLTPAFWVRIADLHLMTGDRVRAMRAVDQVTVALDDEAVPTAFTRASIYARLGRTDAAIGVLDAIQNETNAADVLARKAAVYSLAGQSVELAATVAVLAAREDAPAGLAAFHQAVQAQLAGDIQEAKRLSEAAVEAGLVADFALRTAMMLAMMDGDPAAAGNHADALLAIQPLDAFAHYVKATRASEARQHQEAERHFQISLSQQPAFYVLNDYAVLAIQTGRPELAEHLARNAIASGGGDHAAVWDTLGSALKDLNRVDEAMAAVRTAVQKAGGDDPRIQLNYAEVCLQTGDHGGARRALILVDAGKDVLSIPERERLGRVRRALETVENGP